MKNSHEFLQYLADKLDGLDERLDAVNETLVVQKEQLKEHMRRSEATEQALELMKAEVIKPMQDDWTRVKFVGKIGTWLSAVAAFGYYVVSFIKGLM